VDIFNNVIHVLLAVALASVGNMGYSGMLYLGIIIGSLLPNIDSAYFITGARYSICCLFGKGRCIHRRCTHSLFALVGFSSIAYICNPRLGSGVLFGYLLHILGDALSDVSLPYLLWPYKYDPDHWYFKRS